MLPPRNPDETLKARGAAHRPAGRFEPYQSVPEDDGWDTPPDERLLRTCLLYTSPSPRD